MLSLLKGRGSLLCLLIVLAFGVAGFAYSVKKLDRGDSLPEEAGYGPAPSLPEPKTSLFPTVKVAAARGWPKRAKPQAAKGLDVNEFAAGLQHPRRVYSLPNGDVLV